MDSLFIKGIKNRKGEIISTTIPLVSELFELLNYNAGDIDMFMYDRAVFNLSSNIKFENPTMPSLVTLIHMKSNINVDFTDKLIALMKDNIRPRQRCFIYGSNRLKYNVDIHMAISMYMENVRLENKLSIIDFAGLCGLNELEYIDVVTCRSELDVMSMLEMTRNNMSILEDILNTYSAAPYLCSRTIHGNASI